ncbi:MAG TPA: MarR family transcriptional regulator [Gaiellaceae bacterium]|nr:MarR family transcriptional regulator [Gaiellaceae bacterium]
MPELDTADDIVLPALLRHARSAYAHAIRRRLHSSGYDDLPRNGAYVLGGMVNHDGSPADLIRQLRVSKQAASQLVDTLVLRGYLERTTDPDDRRRTVLTATERGEGAASEVRAGVLEVDAELEKRLKPAGVKALRAGLVALLDINDGYEAGAPG